MVYVVGTDGSFQFRHKRDRNKLFTAMTRAKGWVRLSGVGRAAEELQQEIQKAKDNCPYLRFTYPAPDQLELMHRDLSSDAALTAEQERYLDFLDDTALEEYIAKRRLPRKHGGK